MTLPVVRIPPVPFATGIWIVRTVDGEACYTPARFLTPQELRERGREQRREDESEASDGDKG